MSDNRLKKICGSFRVKMRMLLIQYGVLRTLFFCLFLAAILMFMDWYFRFSPDGRLLSLLTVIGTVGLCYYFDFHRAIGRSWSDSEVLGYLDRTDAVEGDALTTLRDLKAPGKMREYDTEEGKAIVHDIVNDLETKVQKINVGRSFQGRAVNRWRLIAGVVVALYAVGMVFPKSDENSLPASGGSEVSEDGGGQAYLLIGIKRLLMPWALIYWPQKTRLIVQEPESGWRVPKGEQLGVNVTIEGEVPTVVDIAYKNESGENWITERMKVNPETKEATFTFGELMEPLVFYCRGGDDLEERKFSVTVAERPMLTSIKATYTFPPYTNLPKKIISSGQIAGLEGTEVVLEFKASSDLKKVTIAYGLGGAEEGEPIVIKDLDGDEFKYTMQLTKSGRYTIELTDHENLKNGKPERYEIKVEPDKLPEVTMEEPQRDLIMTSRGKLRIKFKAEDDYNLTELFVMLAPEGGKGEPLTDRITGPFWNNRTNMHATGEGNFELDFLKERDKASLKKWKIDEGAELEVWVYAKDCNPNPGITETAKIRISLLQQTDFMDEVVLKTKELMLDARTGWFASAGALHDAGKWISAPNDEAEMENILEQAQTAERAALALNQRFPPIMEHMRRNRMYREFMGKRLEAIGGSINNLQGIMPKVGAALSAGRPSTAAEDTPQGRKAKMAKALKGALANINIAAWKFRFLYNRIADWVDLQSVLLKTRRIEEYQREVNIATSKLVKKTLGVEKEEMEDDVVREMKEVANQQQTVYEMDEAVEKELAKLIRQADKDGRTKIWEFLAKSFFDLRENRIKDKLKRSALAIGDARGDIVKKDQESVLKIIAVLNRGLIKAGEEVPEDPPIKGQIKDPRGSENTVAKVDTDGDEITAEQYQKIEQLRTLDVANKDTLGGALQEVNRIQEDARNRTMHVADRLAGKGVNKRYVRLRVGITSYRQGEVVALLKNAVKQVPEYGLKAKEAKGDEKAVPLDPKNERARTQLGSQVNDLLAAASDSQKLIKEGYFGEVATGVQGNIFRSARDLRVFMQGREAMHSLWIGRKEKGFKDEFDRKYLLREKNLETMVEAGKKLEWALVLQAATQREAEILSRAKSTKNASATLKATADRIKKGAMARNQKVKELIEAVHKAVKTGLVDPTDKEKENEKVIPQLTDEILKPLNLDQFNSANSDFKSGKYGQVALSQEALRGAISATLVSLKDLFDARVPDKPVVIEDLGDLGTVEADESGRIEYRDETPDVLAKLLEENADWIDAVVQDPTVRAKLIKELRDRKKFNVRYSRLQSAYFQAIAQNFQAKAAKKKKEEDK